MKEEVMKIMPPRITFTKESIVDAAFEIYKDDGIEGITIRKVAARLGSSIAPIYSNFQNIDEVKKCIMEKTLSILVQYTEREYSPNPFLNIGLGLLNFARDYGALYKELFINSNNYSYLTDQFFASNLEHMKRDQMLNGFSDEEMRRVLEKIRLFTHGLAALICSGSMRGKSDEYIHQLLKEAGEDIVGYTIYKKKVG
jgi:AcrR family transcriptional regulator